MAANNEIGVLQPLTEIAKLCRAKGVLFHTDATQAAGRIEIDVDAWGVDLLSLSGHKLYGPAGIGALFVRSGVRIAPLTTGGSQERGLRPGTVPTPLVAGFGEACRIACEEWEEDGHRMRVLAEKLRMGLRESFPNVHFFGHSQKTLPGNISVGFPGLRGIDVVEMVSDRVAVSTGSACASATAEASSVLLSLGLSPEIAATGIRISLGRFTTEKEILVALESFSEIRTHLVL